MSLELEEGGFGGGLGLAWCWLGVGLVCVLQCWLRDIEGWRGLAESGPRVGWVGCGAGVGCFLGWV